MNLANHVGPDGLDAERLRRTVRTAVRMLDNVIDINLYTIPEARRSNLRHRPVGLGLMGFQDALFTLRLPVASDAAVEFADESMERSPTTPSRRPSDLAAERGRYSVVRRVAVEQGHPADRLDRAAGRGAPRRPAMWTAPSGWTGTRCGSRCAPPACATPT